MTGKLIRFPIERIKNPKVEENKDGFFFDSSAREIFEAEILYLISKNGEISMRQILDWYCDKGNYTAKVITSLGKLKRTGKIVEVYNNIYRATEPEEDELA